MFTRKNRITNTHERTHPRSRDNRACISTDARQVGVNLKGSEGHPCVTCVIQFSRVNNQPGPLDFRDQIKHRSEGNPVCSPIES